MKELEQRIENAIEFAIRYGETDGSHHKMFVIDQMIRRLCGSQDGEETEKYKAIIKAATADPDYPEWDTGIAP